MDNDGKNNARKRGYGYLGDDHCPERLRRFLFETIAKAEEG